MGNYYAPPFSWRQHGAGKGRGAELRNMLRVQGIERQSRARASDCGGKLLLHPAHAVQKSQSRQFGVVGGIGDRNHV